MCLQRIPYYDLGDIAFPLKVRDDPSGNFIATMKSSMCTN